MHSPLQIHVAVEQTHSPVGLFVEHDSHLHSPGGHLHVFGHEHFNSVDLLPQCEHLQSFGGHSHGFWHEHDFGVDLQQDDEVAAVSDIVIICFVLTDEERR